MNIKKPNSFARYGNDYVAPLTTIDQIVKPSGERYTDKEFELMSNVENVMFGESGAGKNLLNPTLQTTTQNGVTCTNNGDGTYTLNGTATKTSYFYFNDFKMDKPFKLVGCPKGGSQANYHILFKNVNSGGWYEDYGNGVIVNINEKTTYNNFSIKIVKGYTANNLVFKPMLTDDLEATYDDFEPYVKSLKQLTDSALNMDLLWTNASPTSTFEPQTISLGDLHSYKFLKILFKLATNNEKYIFKDVLINGVTICNMGVSTNGRRIVTTSYTDINIGYYCEYATYNDSTETIYNYARIPYQIYGVK